MNYLINSRPYTSLSPLAEEFTYLPNQNYLFNLDYLTTINIEGEKGREFLQGQLSCDVREVTLTQMRQGVMCNLKGRILAILDVISCENNNLSLVLPKDLCDATQVSFSKAAMLSHVKLIHSPTVKVFGLFLNEVNRSSKNIIFPNHRYDVIQNEMGACYKIDNNFYILLVPANKISEVTKPFIEDNCYRGSLAWHALQLQHHRVEIYPESRGLFLPHRLDLHRYGYISFDKGCYKGQEIVARTHYRATLKHQLVYFTLSTNTELKAGLPLFNEDGTTEVGELIDYCPLGDEEYIVSASVLLTSGHPSPQFVLQKNCGDVKH